MLVLTRRSGQIIEIKPDPSLDLATPIGELFARGPIEVVALRTKNTEVKIGIRADLGFLVLRSELCGGKG